MPSNDTMNDESCEYLFDLFERLYRREISPADAKEEITTYLGGSRIRIHTRPVVRKYVPIVRALEEGIPPAAIAERFGVCPSYVFRVRRVMRKMGGKCKPLPPLFIRKQSN